MPKINVYLSDELAAAVRDADVAVSSICQRALADAVRSATATRRTIAALRDPGALPSLDERITERCTNAINRAIALAGPRRRVHAEHLLAGVLDEPGNLGVHVLRSVNADPDTLRRRASRQPPRTTAEPDRAAPAPPRLDRLSPQARDTLAYALQATLDLGHHFLGCEHLILGLATQPDTKASTLLNNAGATPDTLRRTIPTTLGAAALGYHHANPDRLDALERRLAALERRLR